MVWRRCTNYPSRYQMYYPFIFDFLQFWGIGNVYKFDFIRWSQRWLNVSIDDEEIHEDEVDDFFDYLVKQLTKQ
ncbi:hypothetical protein [Cytobacillus sp. IB215665]|uniref:hypothetical protein n=1 Tax=Cytobacillus sp. IB215665 TaxID=3097357 RepID=UPI002A17CC46|nr:hypothetical protein [Cytobacillus sp. IB215665]MDX8367226.1 hypothetical protein [Cytobacillus sp. IB215665]